MLNKKGLIGIVSVVTISLFMNLGGVADAATTSACSNNSSDSEGIDSSEQGATMKDPTSNIKITVEKASSSNMNNSSLDSSENDAREESLEKGATMRDPSFYMEENKKTHVIRWSRTPFPKSMESSDWVGLDSIDDSSSTSSTSSNNKNDAQADSKADKTKTVTNANTTSTPDKTSVVAKKSNKTSTIKSTSNKDISSKSSVLPQTSEKNGSFVSVIVGILLFSVFTLWTFKYELISKHKM